MCPLRDNLDSINTLSLARDRSRGYVCFCCCKVICFFILSFKSTPPRAPMEAPTQQQGTAAPAGKHKAPLPGQIKFGQHSATVTCPNCQQETSSSVQQSRCTLVNWLVTIFTGCCCIFLLPASECTPRTFCNLRTFTINLCISSSLL